MKRTAVPLRRMSLLVSALALVCAGVLASSLACSKKSGGESDKAKSRTLVMVTKAVHPYYEPCYEGFVAAGKKYGVKVERVDPQKMELPL